MPFRHLLFSGQKRQRPAQPISLDSVRYWTIDSEFPTQTWQTDGIYQSSFQPNSADVQDVCMSKQPQSVAHIPYSFDPHNASSAHATYGTTYQPSPSDYEYDSHSLSYSDLLDTDVSSISQGSVHSSVSSTSHVDMMLDEDFDSVHSLSRKSSLASNTEFKAQQERLCPLLTGQVGKCNPSLCGPDAPCLQYINEGPTPIEECVQQNVEQLHISNPIPVDFTTPRTSPQALRHHSTPSLIQHNENTSESAALPTSFDDTRQLAGNNRASTKASSSNDENPRLRQNKKVRARQAHSLVERKYRENLNAKIYELHQLLQHTASNRARQANFPNVPALSSSQHLPEPTEQGDFDYADDKAMLKVKKSDVLVEAISYVHKSEAEMTRMQEQIQQLRDRIQMMEEWIRRGDQR